MRQVGAAILFGREARSTHRTGRRRAAGSVRQRERQPGEVVAGGDRREPDREREPRGAAEVDRALRPAGLRDLRRRATRGACSSSSRRAASACCPAASRARSSTSARRSRRGSEQGLLSIAFAPDYASSGLFYVYFTDKSQDERVVEFKRASATRADPGSERLVLRMDDPEANHNGGLLLFGPDKHMYIGTGDGGGAGDQHGSRGNAQNLGSPLGKILRIDPKQSGGKAYTVPSDNPFVDRAGARGGDLQLRPAQPVALLVRPQDRRPDRSATSGRTRSRRSTSSRRGKGKGANFGWRVFEGRSRYTPGESAPGARQARDHAQPLRRLVLDHRRRRGARQGPDRRCAGATCSATSARSASSRPSSAPARRSPCTTRH